MAEQAWEIKAKERVKAFIKKNAKALEALSNRDAVEADTRTFVTDLLVEGLGFDKYEDLTAEYMVRGEFADIGIRLNKELKAFVEIKRISTELREMHLRQVKTYCANEGVEWAILTNARRWQVYHISNTTPIEEILILDIDLLGEGSLAERAAALLPISKEAVMKNVLVSNWNAVRSLQPESLWKAITTPAVTTAIRAQLRKTTGQLVDLKKLVEAINSLKGN
jgi:predicted type IV restriction endonuclease